VPAFEKRLSITIYLEKGETVSFIFAAQVKFRLGEAVHHHGYSSKPSLLKRLRSSAIRRYTLALENPSMATASLGKYA
jgi:hypothetical protein